MATNEKEVFDSSPSTYFTLESANGSADISGGLLSFEKTVDGWDETGGYSSVKSLTYGDSVEFDFYLDEIASGNSYVQISWRNNATPALTTTGVVGVYCYWDAGGMKAHGNNSGIGVASTPSENMSTGQLYTVKFNFTDPEGWLVVQIKGGTWGDTYQDLIRDSAASTDIDAIASYTNKHFLTQLYSTQSDYSIDRYEWYDSGGPDSSGGSKCKNSMGRLINMGHARFEKENGIYVPRHEKYALAA